jgi:hypothetical protein
LSAWLVAPLHSSFRPSWVNAIPSKVIFTGVTLTTAVVVKSTIQI